MVLGRIFLLPELKLLLEGLAIALKQGPHMFEHVRKALGRLQFGLGLEIVPLRVVDGKVGKQLVEGEAIHFDVCWPEVIVQHPIEQ